MTRRRPARGTGSTRSSDRGPRAPNPRHRPGTSVAVRAVRLQLRVLVQLDPVPVRVLHVGDLEPSLDGPVPVGLREVGGDPCDLEPPRDERADGRVHVLHSEGDVVEPLPRDVGRVVRGRGRVPVQLEPLAGDRVHEEDVRPAAVGSVVPATDLPESEEPRVQGEGAIEFADPDPGVAQHAAGNGGPVEKGMPFGAFGDPPQRLKGLYVLPLLRGNNDGGRVRGTRAGDPRASVLLLLALRARGRAVRPAGRLHGAGRGRKGPSGHPPTDGRVPREGRAGIRSPAGPDRAVRRPRGCYLYLEVTIPPPRGLSPGVTDPASPGSTAPGGPAPPSRSGTRQARGRAPPGSDGRAPRRRRGRTPSIPRGTAPAGGRRRSPPRPRPSRGAGPRGWAGPSPGTRAPAGSTDRTRVDERRASAPPRGQGRGTRGPSIAGGRRGRSRRRHPSGTRPRASPRARPRPSGR